MGHYDSCYEFEPRKINRQIDAARLLHEAEELAKKMKDKPVAQPHYAALKPEPIDVIEAWGLNFYRANALKYIARAGKKDATTEGTIKDLEKAISYLRREVNALSGKPGW